MRDLFFTIVAVYVIWKIMSEISAKGNNKGGSKGNNNNNFTHNNNSSSQNNDDEYTDYEEIK
jgi:hypothetical protein